MTLEQAWQLGRDWFERYASADWAPRTRDQSQAILEGVGLTGPFWEL